LNFRFGSAPEETLQKINTVDDYPTLNEIQFAVLQVTSLEEFVQSVNQICDTH